MADAKKTGGEDAAAEAPPKKKKTKLMIFIAIGVLLVVLVGGGAAYMLLKKGKHAADEEGADAEAAPKTEKVKKTGKEAPPVFVKLDPFTVKLQSDGGESYLQTQVEMRVFDAPVGERIKQYNPEIRHRVLLILSAKKAVEITNPQGVQKLSNELRVAVNRILDGPKTFKGKKKGQEENADPPENADPDDSVQSVLFTSFIVQ